MKRLSSDRFFDALSARTREMRSPEAATFELTYGCNLRCVHCYNPTHRALPQELTTQEVFSILDQLPDLGVVTLTFTGGELLVRPDVFDIFERAKRLGLLLDLISNATRITPAVADRLRQLAFHGLCISIYGATKGTYERITGVPASFEPFLRGLECLASRKLPAVVRMPVMAGNAEEVRAAKALVEGYGFKFQYGMEILPKTNGDPAPLQYRLSPQEIVRLTLDITAERYHEAPGEKSCLADGGFIECACGRNRFAITPYGEMILCTAFPIPKYDLRKGTVREGWDVLKQTVDRARPNDNYECPACDLERHCTQKRNHAWLETGDMSACLPHYKEMAGLEKSLYERLNPRRLD